jgi:hypothetical protein
MAFTVAFGDFEVVKVTNVPRTADYPGAIQLYGDDEGERYTLIPVERVQYQLGRYTSFLGGHGEVIDPDQYGGVPHILTKLRGWLLAGMD